MHHLGPLPLTFEGPEQGSGGKNCQNGRRRKPCYIKPYICPLDSTTEVLMDK